MTVPRRRLPAPLEWSQESFANPVAARVRSYLEASVRSYPVTPMATLEVVVEGIPRTVLLKLEGLSPWRSIKGRTAHGLLASVAHRLDSEQSVVVESTSGNLGIALASICHDVELAFVAVVDSRLPHPLQDELIELGATLDMIDAPSHSPTQLRARVARASELAGSLPHAVWTNQYGNPANVRIHSRWTGPEILRQVGKRVEAVFVPVSTGGTLGGVSECFRRLHPHCEVVAVDVEGSIAFGGTPAPRLLTGIGAGKPSELVDRSTCDDLFLVSDSDAIAACRDLVAQVSIRVGGSSGAALAACVRYLERNPEVETVLCLSPDLGDAYRGTIYDDEWIRRSGVDPQAIRVPGPLRWVRREVATMPAAFASAHE